MHTQFIALLSSLYIDVLKIFLRFQRIAEYICYGVPFFIKVIGVRGVQEGEGGRGMKSFIIFSFGGGGEKMFFFGGLITICDDAIVMTMAPLYVGVIFPKIQFQALFQTLNNDNSRNT